VRGAVDGKAPKFRGIGASPTSEYREHWLANPKFPLVC